ncbi:MAG: uracil-DNA glycosylase, partial [Hydrogenophaga sp.]|nr:uracil-DNA glycosylase [Hydrogenophaga sp.]
APAARPAPVRPPVNEAVVAAPRPVAAPARLRPAGVDAMDWPALQAAVAGCEACGLCRSRQNTVFGVGDRQADWMVIGEAPGENEDLQGEPFVGVAGQLLDNMLRAIGRSRTGSGAQAAYIANVLKCRPPANRNPLPEEVAQCEPYLARQVSLVQPKIILAMGRFAVQSLLQTSEPIGKLRGQVHRYQGVPVIVTYHPAYLLRTPSDKAKAWADLCLALETAAASPDRSTAP